LNHQRNAERELLHLKHSIDPADTANFTPLNALAAAENGEA
jgi:hypothetical protein